MASFEARSYVRAERLIRGAKCCQWMTGDRIRYASPAEPWDLYADAVRLICMHRVSARGSRIEESHRRPLNFLGGPCWGVEKVSMGGDHVYSGSNPMHEHDGRDAIKPVE